MKIIFNSVKLSITFCLMKLFQISSCFHRYCFGISKVRQWQVKISKGGGGERQKQSQRIGLLSNSFFHNKNEEITKNNKKWFTWKVVGHPVSGTTMSLTAVLPWPSTPWPCPSASSPTSPTSCPAATPLSSGSRSSRLISTQPLRCK